jgi:hypothetical protein
MEGYTFCTETKERAIKHAIEKSKTFTNLIWYVIAKDWCNNLFFVTRTEISLHDEVILIAFKDGKEISYIKTINKKGGKNA